MDPEDLPTNAASATQLLRNLMEGRMVDFEIRCKGYTFKVHRIILASASPYFQQVCAGDFKEASDGFVKSETQPMYMAALLLGVYTGQYAEYSNPIHKIEDLKRTLLDRARIPLFPAPRGSCIIFRSPESLYHAKVYKVADFYHVEHVRQLAIKQYTAVVCSPAFTIQELLGALNNLYDPELCLTPDDTLRAITVYLAQRAHHEIIHLPRFETLLHDFPDLAWDFACRYHRANWIYCPECKTNVPLEECQCGFSGVCGYKYCTTQDYAAMRCTTCGRKGHMMKQAPVLEQADEEGENGGDRYLADVIEEAKAHKVPVSPSKKRKTKLASGE